MAEFVETEDFNYVNLAHVVKVRTNTAGKQVLLDADGGSLGVARDEVTNSGTLVAAAAGMFATVVYVGNKPKVRPVDDDVFVERYPIVAWRIRGTNESDESAYPVLAGVQGASNATVLIELPDGKLDEPHSGTYNNIEEAKTTFLERAQNGWDIADRRRREAKAAP
jgi:hypothetical protein